MVKTTLYLPDDLKRAVEIEARRASIPEAEVIRRAIRAATPAAPPRPSGGLFSGHESIAERVDELLVGFGE
ncbi:ribbon-helix-helix protein, CopG family [Tsukamurella sp. PLM1]|uniref:ribbon-helix-helix protein, CopG family n=1 Tax=Tsukamurella sp. PLM1 TaxID=2929795 RepID=UPI002045B405|nr:ribbon-helix-helix protein, CopG family [Tsukamurella sp. PLM1]BDH55463.1 antitoxin VapB26 [Tsukamurella sp. PLM1]